MNPHLARAGHLLRLEKFPQAADELRAALGTDGDDAEAHALLGYCLAEMKQYDAAQRESERAVALAPDWGFTHRMRALVLAERKRYREAAAAAQQAVALDPHDADSFGVLAAMRCATNAWQQALDAADTGLAIDPEHPACNNWRAMALVKLGRGEEAGDTLDATLGRDPNDPFTHANRGWALLERGESREAADHFREALAADPNDEWARAGVVEALKSRNVVYRWLLYYFLWMAKLPPGVALVLIVGGFFGAQALIRLGEANPAIAPYVWPLIIVYGVFALMTWLGQPLFSLVLLTDPLGRQVLSTDQKRQALGVSAMLLTGIAVTVASYASTAELAPLGFAAGIRIALMSLLVSAVFNCSPGWPRWTMLAVAAAVTAMAAWPLLAWGWAILVAPDDVPQWVVGVLRLSVRTFLYAFIAAQFGANWLARQTPTR